MTLLPLRQQRLSNGEPDPPTELVATVLPSGEAELVWFNNADNADVNEVYRTDAPGVTIGPANLLDVIGAGEARYLAPPTGLFAALLNVAAERGSVSGTVRARFDAGADAASVRAERSINGGAFELIETLATTPGLAGYRTADVAGATGDEVTLRLSAFTSAGDAGQVVSVAARVTPDPPASPTNLTVAEDTALRTATTVSYTARWETPLARSVWRAGSDTHLWDIADTETTAKQATFAVPRPTGTGDKSYFCVSALDSGVKSSPACKPFTVPAQNTPPTASFTFVVQP